MRNPGRSPRRALRAATAAAALLACAAPTARAELPASGTGVVSDGVARIALFTPAGDGVAVYRPASGEQVGTTIGLPLNAQGRPFRWRTVGLVDGRVYLAAVDPDRPPTTPGQDHLAVADPASGAVRWLCVPSGTVAGTGVPPCLREPISGPHYTVVEVGKRWMLVLSADQDLTVLRYEDAGGRFEQRALTAAQRRRFERDVPPRNRFRGALNLDGERVTLDRRWSYRRTRAPASSGKLGSAAYRSGTTIGLGRLADRSLGRITFLAPVPNTTAASFGSRGMCVRHRERVVLWDRRTRRIWRRAVAPESTRPTVVCPGGSVVTVDDNPFPVMGPAFPTHVGPVWEWPTTADPAGWTRGPVLRPGRKLTYR